MSGQPTAAFHHALLQQSIIRILLAAPTFPSPSTTITVPTASSNSGPNANSFSRASASAVHLLGEVFRRILCKYAADAGMNAERERRANLGWGDVIRAMEQVNGPAAMEELMEWCASRGPEGAEEAAAEGAKLQRPRLAAAKDEEEDDGQYHFVPLPKSLMVTRYLLDERDREAQEAALQLAARATLPSDDEYDTSSNSEEEDWPLSLLQEAERELISDAEEDEPVKARTAPLLLPPPIAFDPLKKEEEDLQLSNSISAPNGHREPKDEAPMDVDAIEVEPESPMDTATSKIETVDGRSKQLPAVPAPPKSSLPRRKVPPVPIDASLTSGANSYLTPASTLTGSSTDPSLLHMGKQRRTMALVLSDPQRFGPAPSLYGAAPPARSGSEPGQLPFVPGPSLLITLPRPGAQSAAPFFTPVHPYGRTAGGAGAPPGGSLTTVYRHNSDLFVAARTVCDPSLLRRATRTDDPAPLLDESFAERVFQGWPAERDLLEQAALGRGVLAPAVRVLKRQKELKRAEEGGSRKKKKRKKIGSISAMGGGVKGKGRQSGAGSMRGGPKGKARAASRPKQGKSKSIYVDDYDEDEFDEYLDDDAGGAHDDDDGGYGPRGSSSARRVVIEEDDDDSEDEDLKAPESGMLVHTWDWQNRDYTEAMLASQRLRGRLRSGGGVGAGGSGPPGVPANAAFPPPRPIAGSAAGPFIGPELHPGVSANAASTPPIMGPVPSSEPKPASEPAASTAAIPTSTSGLVDPIPATIKAPLINAVPEAVPATPETPPINATTEAVPATVEAPPINATTQAVPATAEAPATEAIMGSVPATLEAPVSEAAVQSVPAAFEAPPPGTVMEPASTAFEAPSSVTAMEPVLPPLESPASKAATENFVQSLPTSTAAGTAGPSGMDVAPAPTADKKGEEGREGATVSR
ncbi:hypothetical protein CF326_g1298 [Tilletia indica]|nr:hypothetical protein CF326_g1298 [Tilletia indica]